VPEWRRRLVCSQCGSRNVDMGDGNRAAEIKKSPEKYALTSDAQDLAIVAVALSRYQSFQLIMGKIRLNEMVPSSFGVPSGYPTGAASTDPKCSVTGVAPRGRKPDASQIIAGAGAMRGECRGRYIRQLYEQRL